MKPSGLPYFLSKASVFNKIAGEQMPTCWIIAGPNGAGRSYLRLVTDLKKSGWNVELIYLALPDAKMSEKRVAERVSHGGHNIPTRDIKRRFPRSLKNLLTEFSYKVDRCFCFMNDGDKPDIVFEQSDVGRKIHNDEYYEILVAGSNQ